MARVMATRARIRSARESAGVRGQIRGRVLKLGAVGTRSVLSAAGRGSTKQRQMSAPHGGQGDLKN